MKKLLLSFFTVLFFFSGFFLTAGDVSVPLVFDQYYSYDMIVDALKALNKAYPKLTQLDLAGTSEEERAIYAMTLNNPETGPPQDKPAVYIDGNIHGNEIQGGEISLYLIDYILRNYPDNPEIRKLMDRVCFYVIPVVNVDGRYHFFQDPNTPSSSRSLRIPKDDDRDGLINEDFPDDLDGDGSICSMRIRDPFGRYKTDPEDPRLMIPVKPGEKGEWTLLGQEGLDNDGDGQINEDAEGYVDPNRNWGFDWKPEYVQSGSGAFPFSGKGIKAVGEYIRARPNICIAWAIHNAGGMFLRGPTAKELGEYPQSDIAVYDYLGDQAERITPGYRYLVSWKDLYVTYGDFMEWMVACNGAFGFVSEVYMSEKETFVTAEEEKQAGSSGESSRRSPDQARERLQFSDHLTQGELYKPWAPFNHPTYGDIEIGGWVKMSSRMSAPFMLREMLHRNASAIIFSAKHAPHVQLDIIDVKKAGPNLYQVRTRLHNDKAVPSMSAYSVRKKLYPKDSIKVEGAEVKAGGEITDFFRSEVNYKEHRPEIQFTVVPGFGKVDHQFLISGKGKITITYQSRFAGKIQKTVELE